MDLLLFLLLFIPCYILSASIHEVGHIVAGILNGFKFYLFVVGPLGFKRNKDNKISFYLEKNPALWGGASATLPQDKNEKNYNAFAKVLLSGPICSIIFSIIFIPISLVTNNIVLILISFMSLGMGVICLIPMRNGCFYTDGGRWLRMHRKDQAGLTEMAIWNITQTYMISSKFSSISLKETEVLKEDKDLKYQYLGYYYTYNYYKEQDDFENAEKEKEQLAALSQKVPKNFLKLFPM